PRTIEVLEKRLTLELHFAQCLHKIEDLVAIAAAGSAVEPQFPALVKIDRLERQFRGQMIGHGLVAFQGGELQIELLLKDSHFLFNSHSVSIIDSESGPRFHLLVQTNLFELCPSDISASDRNICDQQREQG